MLISKGMPHAEDNFGFPAQNRIKSSLQIKQLVDLKKSVFAYPLKCYYQVVSTTEQVEPAIAVVVPKKKFKHAVDRNRLKRLMRESYRLSKSSFVKDIPSPVQVQMCWVYVGKELSDFEAVSNAVSSIYKKLLQIIQEEQS